jgi:hypothetical protein
MTTITFEKEINIKSHFIDLKDMYLYMIDNQLITEIWFVDEKDLSKTSIELYKESKNKTNLINI